MVSATEYIFFCKRAILFLSSSKILTPHPPLRPASVYPRLCCGGSTDSPEQKFNEASCIILRISKGFLKQAKPFDLFFSSTRQAEHLKTSVAHGHKVQIQFFYAPLKDIHLMTQSLWHDGQLGVTSSLWSATKFLLSDKGNIVDYGIRVVVPARQATTQPWPNDKKTTKIIITYQDISIST
jgi:hypothetical protein